MALGVVVASPRDADVLIDGGLALLPKLKCQDLFEDLELDADQLKRRRQGDRVLHQVAPGARRQLLDRERAQLHAVGWAARLDLVGIEEHHRTGPHEVQVAIHGVLVEGDEQVERVAAAEHGSLAGSEGEEDMAAAHDGLIRAVGLEMQTAAYKDPCQHVAGSGDTLARRATDADCQLHTHHSTFISAIYGWYLILS